MPNLAHVALNSDDPTADRRFYEAVFGWRFTAWGPPGFYRVEADDPLGPGVTAAIQQRRELSPGRPSYGLEGTVAVDDVEATAAAVVGAGGSILQPGTTIAGVGHLVWFADPSGNVMGAMQYDQSAE